MMKGTAHPNVINTYFCIIITQTSRKKNLKTTASYPRRLQDRGCKMSRNQTSTSTAKNKFVCNYSVKRGVPAQGDELREITVRWGQM